MVSSSMAVGADKDRQITKAICQASCSSSVSFVASSNGRTGALHLKIEMIDRSTAINVEICKLGCAK